MVYPNLTRIPYRQRRSGRVGEFVVATALLAFTLPLTVIVAIAIKFESRGPIFIQQRRIGAAGEHYVALKFRTTVDKSAKLPRDSVAMARHMTRVGRFLRYTRIENLPQLVNVLRGEMSCINPRFERPFFLD
jgi:lipopolysaccharide/colanic/teichoic acid biosynthesis glycosyltransferase